MNKNILKIALLLASIVVIHQRSMAACTFDSYINFNISSKQVCPGQTFSVSAYYYDAASYQISLNGQSYSQSWVSTLTLSAKGKYPLTLKITNSCGKDTTLRDTVEVRDDISYQESYPSTYVFDNISCPNEDVGMQVFHNGTITYYWSFGDGTTGDNNYHQTHKYATTGRKIISVKLTNRCGSDTTLYDSTIINGNLPMKVSYAQPIQKSLEEACTGDKVTLHTPVNAKTYKWDMGDGVTTYNSNSIDDYKYQNTGIHPVKLTLTNGCNRDTILHDTIHVLNNIRFSNVYYDISPKITCPDELINLSTNIVAKKYLWNLGNGVTSTEKYTNTKYNSVKKHPISLKLTNNCNIDTTVYDTVAIVNNLRFESPIDFYIPKKIGCPGESFYFSSSTSSTSYTWSFGDGTKSYGNYTDHAFATAGKYTISLRLVNGCGHDTTVYDTIYIKSNLHLNGSFYFHVDKKTACPGEEIYFSCFSSTVRAFKWTLESGFTKNSYYIYYNFNTSGTKPIQLTLTNYCGLDTTIYDTIKIKTNIRFPANTQIIYPQTPKCSNEELYFRAYNNYVKTATWNFGDGTSEVGRIASKTYTSVGNYKMTAKVTNFCNIDTIITDTIRIKNNLPFSNTIDINIMKKEGCPGDLLSMYAYPDAVNYSWNFGDGSTSTEYNTEHTYGKEGEYKVVTTMTNGCGRDTSLSDTIKIKPNIRYTGNINWNIYPKTICPGETVKFSCYQYAISYLWNFGDSTYAMQKDQSEHVYKKVGKYPISLKLTNGCGYDTTAYDTIVVTSVLPFANTYINWNISSNKVCPGAKIEFNTSQNAVSYLWNFGDGNISKQNYTKHAYDKPGKYLVSLTLVNGCANDTTISENIEISNNLSINPNIDFSIMPEDVCPGDIVEFRPEYHDATSFNWSYGDGATSADFKGSHAYPFTGKFNVLLTATNGCGHDTTISKKITIGNSVELKKSDIEFGLINKTACIGDTVTYFIYPPNFHYSLKFDDGVTTTNYTIFKQENGYEEMTAYLYKHAFKTLGNHKATITVTNNCGKSFTDSIFVNITNSNTLNVYLSWMNSNNMVDSSIMMVMQGASKYILDFGDASKPDTTFGSFGVANHIFKKADTYTLTLKASNNCGQTRTYTYPIKISSPTSGINSVNIGYCKNDSVQYKGGFYKTPQILYTPITADSAIILRVTDYPSYNITVDTQICKGSIININGTFYASQGVTVTDTLSSRYGCDSIVTYTLKYDTSAYKENICLVTINPTTGKNMVVWERQRYKRTTGYTVYRESSTYNIYDSLAFYPFDSLSVYVDKTSKPEQQQYLYKLGTRDVCGNKTKVSSLSYHKTLFLQYVSAVGGVNLHWYPYEINGSPFSFNSYIIYRGSDSLALAPIDTVSGSLNAYTDTDIGALSSKRFYRIAGVKADACNPANLKSNSGPFSQSISNLEDNRLKKDNSINENLAESVAFNIYPNPASDLSNIEYKLEKDSKIKLSILNILGVEETILINSNQNSGNYKYSYEASKPGIYFVILEINDQKIIKALVKTK